MALERELKYSVLDGYVPALSELRAVLATTPYRVEAAPVQEITDRYYDDDAGSLRGAGLALRRRTVGGSSFATLKEAGASDAALHERDELELPVDTASGGGSWPDAILARLPDPLRTTGLRVRVELATTRVRFHLQRGDRPVVEIAFDAVMARLPGAERSAHFDEVEIEALDDVGRDELETVAQAVDGVVKLTPNPVDKLERAAALLLLATW